MIEYLDLTTAERICVIEADVFFLLRLCVACYMVWCLRHYAKKRKFKAMVQAVRADILGDSSDDGEEDDDTKREVL